MVEYTAWRGALEITVQGFITIPVKFHNRTAPGKGVGFSLISPTGQPVKQKYITDDDSWRGTVGE